MDANSKLRKKERLYIFPVMHCGLKSLKSEWMSFDHNIGDLLSNR